MYCSHADQCTLDRHPAMTVKSLAIGFKPWSRCIARVLKARHLQRTSSLWLTALKLLACSVHGHQSVPSMLAAFILMLSFMQCTFWKFGSTPPFCRLVLHMHQAKSYPSIASSYQTGFVISYRLSKISSSNTSEKTCNSLHCDPTAVN